MSPIAQTLFVHCLLGLASCADSGTMQEVRPAPVRSYVQVVFEPPKTVIGPPAERFIGYATSGKPGRVDILIHNLDKSVSCKGRARVTKMPKGPGALGLEGEAFVKCTDGRIATADYRYTTNTRGIGVGDDQYGGRFTIRFMEIP